MNPSPRPVSSSAAIIASTKPTLSARTFILNSFSIFLSLSFFITIMLIGSYDYFRNVEKNKCEMTYMYEFPQYVKIPLNNEEDDKFPMYGLYAYTEGKLIENVRKHKFTGIPVLFIPGNAGSYKQVRSFASVALRKWLNNRTPYHFDFFSLDFNDELSGIYGYVLKKQSEYTKHAVNRIMSFYEDFHHVVIIGHSMGGQIAKTLNDEDSKIQLIYTFATPHLQPILIADPEIDLFYYYLSKNWTLLEKENSESVTLLSLAGGDRDLIVPNKLTKWKFNVVQTSTTSVPTIWASTDHLCIVWCKQVVMAVVRSLFDMVELKKRVEYYAISQNNTLRESILRYHFLQRTSGKSYHEMHPNVIEGIKPPSAIWTEYLVPEYCEKSINKLTYVMFPMKIFERHVRGDPWDMRILVSTINTEPKNWIFGCKGQTIVQNIRICSSMVNLSNQTQLIPSYRRRRKIIHLEYVDIKEYSHLIIRLDPNQYPCCVTADAYNIRDRTKILGDKFPSDNKMFYKLHLPVLYNTSRLFAWRVYATLNNNSKCDGHHNSVGIFRYDHQQTNNFFKNESILVRFADWKSSLGMVYLYLDNNCNYTISARVAWVQTAGQIFRTYYHLLPSYFASIILMTLAFQPSKGWNNFPRVLLTNAYYLTIIPSFMVTFALISIPNDYALMMDPEEYTVLLPFGLYFVSFIIVLAVGVLTYFLLLTIGNSYHALIMRFFTKRLGNVPEKVTELALNFAFDKFPITIGVLIVAVALSTCGSMGFGVGMFFFLVKIFKSYEGILEDLVRSNSLNPKEIFSASNFQHHFGVLWLTLTALNIPGLFYWINNFKFADPPQWDLSLYLCLMVSPSLAILWQGFTPDFNTNLWKLQRCMCYFTGLACVIWGTFRLYLISFLIVIVILSIAGCQLISLMAPTDSIDNSQDFSSGDVGNKDGHTANKESLSHIEDVSNSSEEEDMPMEETESDAESIEASALASESRK